MKRNSFLILLLLLSCLFGKKFVAVLEMEPIGLTEQEGRILTQRLTSEIINANVYSVVERTNIEKILGEQKFQHSGCTDSECAVEIGQLVNAHYIVIGSASKFGSTYTIDVRMIDVAMGNAISTAVFNHKGELDGLITDGIGSVARKLSGLEHKAGKKFDTGVIDIKSNPQGADIYIGDDHYNKTPFVINDFPIGKYDVRIKLEGYRVVTQHIKVKKNTTTYIKAILPPIYIGYLDLKIIPENADILIDSNKQNKKENYQLSPGEHEVQIKAPFYKNVSKTVRIYNEEHATLDISLERKDPRQAKKLSRIFPGLGHLYADKELRGQIWLAAGIAAIVNTYAMYSELVHYSNAYETANREYLEAPDTTSEAEFLVMGGEREYFLDKKNNYALNLVVSSSLTLGVWLWNVVDVKNAIPNDQNNNNKINMGMNSKGQIEARFAF